LILVRVLPCHLPLDDALPGFTFRGFWQRSSTAIFCDPAAIEAICLCQQQDLFGIVCFCTTGQQNPKSSWIKLSKKSVRTKATATPELRFEDQRLTSFAGLVVIQKFFQLILGN
jgi:hypothetical protein